jgi:hypothetical protein
MNSEWKCTVKAKKKNYTNKFQCHLTSKHVYTIVYNDIGTLCLLEVIYLSHQLMHNFYNIITLRISALKMPSSGNHSVKSIDYTSIV